MRSCTTKWPKPFRGAASTAGVAPATTDDAGFACGAGLAIVSHTPARQSQQSCALWARYAALAVLGCVRISFANPSRNLRIGGPSRS